jgi:predicted transposase/invertase (TIGR01784 family)
MGPTYIGNCLDPRYKIVAKTLLGSKKYKNLCVKFLTAILKLPADEYDTIEFCNQYLYAKPGMNIEEIYIGDALIRTKSGIMISIAIQRDINIDMYTRSSFYSSRIFCEQYEKNRVSHNFQKLIYITITDYLRGEDSNENEENNEYHSEMGLMDADTHEICSYGNELHFIELSKLKNNCDHTVLWDILNFFNVKNKNEIALLEKNPNTKDFVEALRELSKDEKIIAIADTEDQYGYDLRTVEAVAKDKGEAKGKIEVAKNLLTMNLPIEQITTATGLSIEEIKKLN